jgi:hypothetical protein
MKTQFIALLILPFCFISASFSQTPVTAKTFNHSFVAFTLGPNIPLGAYTSTTINDARAGFATSGMNYNLSLNALLGKGAGICLLLSTVNNPVDEDELRYGAHSTYPGLTWQVNTTPWKMTNFLFGFCTSTYEDGGRFALNMRFMLGMSSCTSPEIEITATDQYGYSASNRQSDKTRTALGLGAGMHFSHNLTKGLGFILGADFISANPKFEFGGGTDETKQPMRVINIAGGIGYMF